VASLAFKFAAWCEALITYILALYSRGVYCHHFMYPKKKE